MENVINHIQDNRNKYIEELKDILKIPSISTNKEHKTEVINCAKYLEKEFNDIGLENVKLKRHPHTSRVSYFVVE